MNNKETIQAHNMDLQRIKDTIAALPSAQKWHGGGTIIPSKEDIVIPAFTNTELTVKGDTDLKPENIKSDIKVFGVTGSLEPANTGSFYYNNTVLNNTFTIATNQPPQYIMYGARYSNYYYHGVGYISFMLNSDGKGYTRTYYYGHFGQSASMVDEYFYPDADVTINSDGSVTVKDKTAFSRTPADDISRLSGIYG